MRIGTIIHALNEQSVINKHKRVICIKRLSREREIVLRAGGITGNCDMEIDSLFYICRNVRLIVHRTLCCRTCPTFALGPAWGPLRSRSAWGPVSPVPRSPSRASFGMRLKEVRSSLQLNSPICLYRLRILHLRPFLVLSLTLFLSLSLLQAMLD